MSEKKETVEFAFDKIEQYFEAAKQVIEQYGGDVAELGLMALRVEAISCLLPGLIIIILARPLYKVWKKIGDYEEAHSYGRDRGVTVVAGATIGAILLILTLVTLFNIWSWVGIFYPELYAVYKMVLS